ncbi:MAG: helix-turn-helix domain-containing protein [Galactobacter sp.]
MPRNRNHSPLSGPQMTVLDVAELIGCEHKTVRRLIDRGELPAYRFGTSRVLRIDPADVQRLMTEVNPVGRALHQGDAA